MRRTRKIKRRRAALFQQQNGICYWCPRECILPEHHPDYIANAKAKAIPKNLATLDHLRDRHHPQRRVPANGEQRLVMSCWDCNHQRGQESEAEVPIEELRRRSGRKPRHLTTFPYPTDDKLDFCPERAHIGGARGKDGRSTDQRCEHTRR